MDWDPKIKKLYKNVVADVPLMFRPVVKPLLHETAEKKCRSRNSGIVNEADLITALLEITPKPFLPNVIDSLDRLNIDLKRYTQLSEIQSTYKASWEELEAAFHPGNMHFCLYITDK